MLFNSSSRLLLLKILYAILRLSRFVVVSRTMSELSVVSVGGCLTKSNENNKEDLLHDLASIVYSICAKLYGQRRAKRKAERLVEQLEAKDGQE
jgi:predicted site-specific integrase-resolvase